MNDDAASAACLNTDREIWREREGDAYADSIHVTEGGGIGINCGGMVSVKPIREWHRLAAALASTPSQAVQAEAGETPRCEVCAWPLVKERSKGCVPGDCSYRPDDFAEQERDGGVR